MDITMCPKCGIILAPKEEGELVFLECGVCGFRKEYKDRVEYLCPVCKHSKAIILYSAMTRGDEDATTLYKCINCGATNKEGYKGG